MPAAIQPLDLLEGKRTLPTALGSADMSLLGQQIREQSFWMARVAEAEILQEMQDIVGRSARGEAGEFELRREWEHFLDARGYQPRPGEEGTIRDLRSLRRFNIALRTNRAVMNNWARKQNGLSPGPLRAAPAWELVRYQDARVPRDWTERWAAVGGQLFGGRIIAPKTDPVWAGLGSPVNFPDALGNDHPPFAWSSGMRWRPVRAPDAVRLGVMTRGQIIAQADAAENPSAVPPQSPGNTLAAAPRVTDPAIREHLRSRLAGLARPEGDRLIYTDPNGTRPGSVETIAETITAALPEDPATRQPFPQHQAAALRQFVADPALFLRRAASAARQALAQLLARIAGDRAPELLAKVFAPGTTYPATLATILRREPGLRTRSGAARADLALTLVLDTAFR